MYDDGIGNDFEHAHQKGLTRGFDLGWSYKGRFDRQMLRDYVEQLDTQLQKATNNRSRDTLQAQIDILQQMLKHLKEHQNNREFIT